MSPSPADQQLVAQLRANQPEGFTFLYQHSYPAVERYVRQNQGTTDEAKDVFQDTLLILLSNVREPEFQLTASLKTYVFSISKHLWLKHLRQKTRLMPIEASELSEKADEPASVSAGSSVFDMLGAVLASATARCLALLTALFFQKKFIDALVEEAGYANRHTAQNQKYKCLEQARRQGRDLLHKTGE
jgi:DNA-directed RNA polymerase specialized sigma24 family protein